MGKKKETVPAPAINRLRDAVAQYEFTSSKGSEVSYYHLNSDQWYRFRIHGMGIEYKAIDMSEIPADAICVTQGYFKRETKELVEMMNERVQMGKSLEDVVRNNEKKAHAK